MTYTLHHGDCLDVLPTLPDASVDAVIADPPYGTTACKWDSPIPFEPMWRELKRVIWPRGAIVLFGSQPFTSALVMSWPQGFKYTWVWYKNAPTGVPMANFQPMRCYEDIAVFSCGTPIFNKQPTRSRIADRPLGRSNGVRASGSNHYSFVKGGEKVFLNEWVNPRNVLEFPIEPMARGRLHPTQKPLALLEYLVRTYTNEGDTVLDFTMGSGTTGHACVNTGRNFVGIERDRGYFEIAERRIRDAADPLHAMREAS